MTMPITFYRERDEPYGCFSNFSQHSFEIDGTPWQTIEHYFQAMKFVGTPHEEAVRLAKSPMEAKTLGNDRTRPLRPDWEAVKDDLMRRAVRAKFTQQPEICAVPLGTDSEELIEAADNDAYWGWGPDHEGKNMLGKLLMEIRDELRKWVPNMNGETAIIGCLLGTAVGDAMGLVCEGLPHRRMERLYPHLDGPRLIGHYGMVSDDTEHTCLVAQALIASAGDPAAFTRQLSHGLRLWLATFPAGVGWATLRATLKLNLGVSPERSGVRSAGNGPAMRSALLGVCCGDQPRLLRELVRVSTRLTHTDPRAEAGALAVAVAAHTAGLNGPPAALPERYLSALKSALGPDEAGLLPLAVQAAESAAKGRATTEFAASIGAEKKVTGYIYQTVPVTLHAWLRNPNDYRAAVLDVIACGGDTDTTAAIVGAIVGAGLGKHSIPPEWLDAIWERPRSVAWIERLGAQLAEVRATDTSQQALRLPFLPLLGRNVVFAGIVIAHGLRRLLPPY